MKHTAARVTNPLSGYSVDPRAKLYPRLSKTRYAELKRSLKHYGQLRPIVALGTKILDGWYRLNACRELGIEPKIIQFSELGLKITPAAWLFETGNKERRITPEQWFAILNAYVAERRERLRQVPTDLAKPKMVVP